MKKVKIASKGKLVRLSKVRIKQNLGDGFLRTVFATQTIDPNEFLTIDLTAAEGRVVVNAGWSITGGNNPAYATNSFPLSTTVWRLILRNPTNNQRTVTPYLITKLAPA
ncbi:hypothetical protein ACFQ88_04885 [Paenibacillus sp. NPDC056579]|uniref:hypothetical protein n=1 Tax=unclassified Paenibacillus TaxID=185978 RepID=UPI001EF86595|nr:hypothetical protein [Paenibacillus sp. H1-7]ULL16320.1 hypothetical protein DVH26_18825 [Paenibacillus sp. H1-7]